jgi:HPt (histidine-containing phosphotransfer) domain-containing protein
LKPNAEEATRKMLAVMWERNLPILRERINEIEKAASAAADGSLTSEARASASGTAHKLAGSLGMFGYPRGTDLARKLEVMFDFRHGDLDVPKLAELAQALRDEVHL